MSSSSLLAHRQDECLQAALIDVGAQEVRVFLSITPGAEVATRFRAVVDTDANGMLSGAETAAYATNVVSQLILRTDDGERRLELRTFRFPEWDAIRGGTGTIQIEAGAKVPAWTDGAHRLRFENRHLTNLSVYVVAALQPEGGQIAIGRQQRNENQSVVDIRLTTGEPR